MMWPRMIGQKGRRAMAVGLCGRQQFIMSLLCSCRRSRPEEANADREQVFVVAMNRSESSAASSLSV